jgi:hypothetical protein
MKIGETQSIASVVPTVAPVSSPVSDTTPPAPVDRVTTQQTSDLRSSVAAGVALAATERALHLQSLAQAVRSGVYRPNASHLADQILARADLDARVAAALAHG